MKSPDLAMSDAQTSKGTATIAKPAVLVSMMTLLSRLFGFVRDVMLAQLFGATAAVDAF